MEDEDERSKEDKIGKARKSRLRYSERLKNKRSNVHVIAPD